MSKSYVLSSVSRSSGVSSKDGKEVLCDAAVSNHICLVLSQLLRVPVMCFIVPLRLSAVSLRSPESLFLCICSCPCFRTGSLHVSSCQFCHFFPKQCCLSFFRVCAIVFGCPFSFRLGSPIGVPHPGHIVSSSIPDLPKILAERILNIPCVYYQ